MYKVEDKLEQFRSMWLTKRTYNLIKLEKLKLKKEGKQISMVKILNNLILEKYEERKS